MKKVFLILTLLFCVVLTKGQTITGKVYISGTSTAIANASIYYDGTFRGTTSNAEGSFTIIKNNQNSPLVISAVGYYSVRINDYSSKDLLKIFLKPKIYEIEEVVVTISDGMSRKAKEKIFKKEFLGDSYYAASCDIVNIDEIRFAYTNKTETLKAFCKNPIIIKNNALGYTLYYKLEEFIKDPKRISFKGNYFFIDDSLKTPLEIKKAARNRQEVYKGSRMHFIRSLTSNTLSQEGFKVYGKDWQPLNANNITIKNSDSSKSLYISDQLKVIHTKSPTHSTLIKNKEYTSISDDGFFDPDGFSCVGPMGNQRVGDLLPYEYGLAIKNEIPPFDLRKQLNQFKSGDFISSAIDTFRKLFPIEKLYIHTDRSYYGVNDTLWFKTYLFNQTSLTPPLSRLINIELVSENNVVLKRILVSASSGLIWGSLPLPEKEVPEGNYTLRAYTNYMKNFGNDYIFLKPIIISHSSKRSWLVGVKTNSLNQKSQIDLHFQGLDNQPISFRDLQLQLQEETKVIYNKKLKTGSDGKLVLNFPTPFQPAGKNITLQVEDLQSGGNRKILIPIQINDSLKTDLQFMPEGGHLIAGFQTSVGFKAISESGEGQRVSGEILNNKGEQVALFKSSELGIGAFNFIPRQKEVYFARLLTQDGSIKNYDLPTVKSSGTALHILNLQESDTVSIDLMVSLDLQNSPSSYYLTAQSRGLVCYLSEVKFTKGIINLKVAKKLFPTGLARFTLMNSKGEPLNERLIFIDHLDNLILNLKASQSLYSIRDSISLQLDVKDRNGNDIKGSFSVSVTDDSQVRADTSTSIETHLFLTSDLKGKVENPGYYFDENFNYSERWKALDHLLLTQGWVGYDWPKVFKPTTKQFQAEEEFLIKGSVINGFNKPIESSKVILLSNQPEFVKQTATDKEGKFIFNNFPSLDMNSLIIQAYNKNGRSFNIGIKVNEPEYAEFPKPTNRAMPWFVKQDSNLIRTFKNQIKQEDDWDKTNGSRALDEVIITATKIIKGSQNLNGAGNADQILDEKDLDDDGKKTLMQLLEEKIWNFRTGGFSVGTKNEAVIWNFILGYTEVPSGQLIIPKGINNPWYFIKGKPVKFIVDGLPITAHLSLRSLTQFQNYFKSITADEISGIEVNSSSKYSEKYIPVESKFSISSSDIAFIEITTRSGGGPAIERIPGQYFFKPLAPSYPKQFYKPKYTLKDRYTSQDLRNTIHWEPNLVTDSTGKAVFSFYSADNKSTYTVIVEGSDMNGNVGSKIYRINVK